MRKSNLPEKTWKIKTCGSPFYVVVVVDVTCCRCIMYFVHVLCCRLISWLYRCQGISFIFPSFFGHIFFFCFFRFASRSASGSTRSKPAGTRSCQKRKKWGPREPPTSGYQLSLSFLVLAALIRGYAWCVCVSVWPQARFFFFTQDFSSLFVFFVLLYAFIVEALEKNTLCELYRK